VRHAAWAALVAADGKPDAAWTRTAQNPETRAVLIDSIGLLLDPAMRAAFQPLLAALLIDAKTSSNVRSAAIRALPLMGTDYATANFKTLAGYLRQGRDLSDAARSVMQLPRDTWVRDEAAPVAESILTWAKTVPVSRRTDQDYVETVQVGMEMAALLPPADSIRIRKQLLDLGVRVFAIKTVREQMRYDTTRIVVEAGKPFEIILENLDMMPHNLVIVQPGAREEVGTQAQTMQPTPDRRGKVYVPNNRKILSSSKLLEPGQKETLKMTAPLVTGNYDYVCTYPEHWKVMFGQLIVVKDMDEFLKASAENPPPPQLQAGVVGHDHNHH
jgi:azurin